ncbi:hypothetical protein BDP55DRAFT_684803 [Colletotrichum godetiae]|uniref:Uncharacterized protein n=1 Tax=Colletotrichum godetiae TaxID=1209918 RepID=A0AAJ0AAY5_9PEZI|nr:uncharacterized protein BDP55DRAFT_684803 [Colletotrichum godetiae]KAK1657700.1 hypothetical protein BDP55DRAFT_684803 [Colletotrichum godetiae]
MMFARTASSAGLCIFAHNSSRMASWRGANVVFSDSSPNANSERLNDTISYY